MKHDLKYYNSLSRGYKLYFGLKSIFLEKHFVQVFFLCLVFSLNFVHAKFNQTESLPLYVGIEYDYRLSKNLKGKRLRFEGTYKHYTGLKYNRTLGTLRFTPRKIGLGVINIKDRKEQILKTFSVRVRNTDLHETATEVQSLLKDIDGISIKVLNNRVIIDGEIVVPRDIRRVHDVVVEYKGKATSLVTLSPLAQNKLAKFIEKEINNPNVTVRATNMTFILEGFVNSPEGKTRAKEIADLYVPDYIVDLAVSQSKIKERVREPVLNYIKVIEKKSDGRRKLIQLIIHYVELNKDYADNFRFQWTPQIEDGTRFTFTSGTLGLGRIGGIISGTINNFLPKLNWAKSFGFARILHSANVVTEDQKAASIQSQKMIPYQATSGPQGEQSIALQPTGISISLTPIVVGPRGDSIQLSNINFKVNNLVGSSGGTPITTTRSLQTSIHVQNGLSAVIGGIISNKTFSDYNREPNSQESNPLFSFLSSKKFNRSQSQFVIFVTPIIKSSASAGVNRIKKKFKLFNN